MKLLHSPASPFVRKVTIAAQQLGLTDQIELLRSPGNVMVRDEGVRAVNPLGQLPALVTDDGLALYGSGVICAFLNDRAGGTLFGAGDMRWAILTDMALGDGLLEAALSLRYETAVRPAEYQWQGWVEAMGTKITDALDRMEQAGGALAGRVDMGVITFACALSYLDWRFADLDWRADHPKLADWYAGVSQGWFASEASA